MIILNGKNIASEIAEDIKYLFDSKVDAIEVIINK